MIYRLGTSNLMTLYLTQKVDKTHALGRTHTHTHAKLAVINELFSSKTNACATALLISPTHTLSHAWSLSQQPPL